MESPQQVSRFSHAKPAVNLNLQQVILALIALFIATSLSFTELIKKGGDNMCLLLLQVQTRRELVTCHAAVL